MAKRELIISGESLMDAYRALCYLETHAVSIQLDDGTEMRGETDGTPYGTMLVSCLEQNSMDYTSISKRDLLRALDIRAGK